MKISIFRKTVAFREVIVTGLEKNISNHSKKRNISYLDDCIDIISR